MAYPQADQDSPMYAAVPADARSPWQWQRGLEFVERIGCSSRVSTESDSLELIQCCTGTTEVWNPYAAILADCFLQANMMTDVSFHHCPRSANQVAHELAKFAYSSKETHVWDGDPPGFIFPHVIRDVTLLSTE
jgi:hypothetical protein